MTTTRQQLTIASFRELWKNEFLPEIRKEIDSANASLYTEIRDLNKRLDEFEKTLSFFSEQYDQLIKITQTTKKQMQQIESKIEDQGKTITGLKNNDYDNLKLDQSVFAIHDSPLYYEISDDHPHNHAR